MVVISCYNLEQGKEEDWASLSLSEAIYVWGRETPKHVSYFVSLSRTVSCLISKKITGRGSAVPMTGLNQSDSSSRARERVWIFLEIRVLCVPQCLCSFSWEKNRGITSATNSSRKNNFWKFDYIKTCKFLFNEGSHH